MIFHFGQKVGDIFGISIFFLIFFLNFNLIKKEGDNYIVYSYFFLLFCLPVWFNCNQWIFGNKYKMLIEKIEWSGPLYSAPVWSQLNYYTFVMKTPSIIDMLNHRMFTLKPWKSNSSDVSSSQFLCVQSRVGFLGILDAFRFD